VNTWIIAIIRIAFLVAARFSFKTALSGAAIKAVMTQPFALRTLFSMLTEKYVFSGF